jgi:hypothetical protein
VNFLSDILLLSHSEENVGVQWASIADIYGKKVCDLVRREVMYNVLTEFDMPTTPVRPIKVCVNKTCCRIYVSEHLFDAFHIHSGLRQGDFLVWQPYLFYLAIGLQLRFRMCY